MTSVDAKVARLRELLAELPSALIAYSGGVDSSFLLRVAHEVLGPHCLALTTVSAATPEEDLETAKRLTAALGAAHVVVDVDELAIEGYAANASNRCFFCKDNLFTVAVAEARRRGLAAVLDGANVDDLADHRPGLQAAAAHGVRHPLVEAEFSKTEIRDASQTLGLSTWDRPASPCLSSRFAYGTRITAERLAQVAAAERFLRAQGLREFRVRHHEHIARLEVPIADMPRLLAPGVREAVVQELKRLGFAYVALDLQGFRSGSLNETLPAAKTRRAGGLPPALRIR